MFFIFMHKQEVNLLHGCAWNMRCTMQAFSNWCYHFFVFQIVKWIFVILNQIPIYKNNIKGNNIPYIHSTWQHEIHLILGQTWISIYFVGRWCNKLLKNPINLQSSPIGTGTQTLMIYGGYIGIIEVTPALYQFYTGLNIKYTYTLPHTSRKISPGPNTETRMVWKFLKKDPIPGSSQKWKKMKNHQIFNTKKVGGGGWNMIIYSQTCLFSLTVLGDSNPYGNMMMVCIASKWHSFGRCLLIGAFRGIDHTLMIVVSHVECLVLTPTWIHYSWSCSCGFCWWVAKVKNT